MGYSVVIRTRDRGKRKKLEIQTTKDFMCWDNWDLFSNTEKVLMFFKKRTDMIKFHFLKICWLQLKKNNKGKDCSRIQLF